MYVHDHLHQQSYKHTEQTKNAGVTSLSTLHHTALWVCHVTTSIYLYLTQSQQQY